MNCRYCKRGLIHPSRDIPARNQPVSATKDHIIAKSRGGSFKVTSCYQCNQLKGALSLIEWARFMQANPEWWERFRTHGQVKNRLFGVTPKKTRFPFRVARAPLCKGLAA